MGCGRGQVQALAVSEHPFASGRDVPVFALVDCNNFYASCEKLFDLTLTAKPIVVLSNNDGCVVARSAEAKALGVPMGAPWHQLRELALREGIIAFSSNYALYADMSNRVVEVLGLFASRLEVYSIDESFLDLSGYTGLRTGGLASYGHEIRQRIAAWLGLAVCVGIGPTKTLAKLANHCAKKSLAGAGGVCDFTAMPERELDALFARIEVDEVWGVGRKISARLEEMRLLTVQDLRTANTDTIRARFSVVLERTVRELRGVSCLALEEMVPAKQQIMSSRSFGQYVYELPELKEAVASYISKAAEKLRAQQSVAGAVQVFIRTNPFKPNVPQYQRAVMIPLPEPSADTRVLTRWAMAILEGIYKPGFAYQKAGVMLSELRPRHNVQGSLIAVSGSDARSESLMRVMDEINRRWGQGTLKPLVTGVNPVWRMRRDQLSFAWTTNWNELPVALAR